MKKLNSVLLTSAMGGIGNNNVQITTVFNKWNKPIYSQTGESKIELFRRISVHMQFKNGQRFVYVTALDSCRFTKGLRGRHFGSKKNDYLVKKQVYDQIARMAQAPLIAEVISENVWVVWS